MTYEMDKVVSLLRKEFSQVYTNQNKQSLEYLRAIYPVMTEYITNSRVHLRELLVYNAEKRLTALVPLYQRDITRSLDVLRSYQAERTIFKKRTIKERIQQCFDRLIYQLKRLLEYIFTDFADYYNSHQKIPDYVKDVFIHIFEEDKQMVEKWLGKQVIGAGLELQLVKPFADFLKRPDETSHCRLAYLREYSKRIWDLAELHKASDQLLISFLIGMRYNTDECVKACLATLQKSASEFKVPVFIKKSYCSAIIFIRRSRIEGISNYQSSLPEIEQRICDYLQADIGHIEDEKKNNTQSIHTITKPGTEEKIMLSWSVQEASLLLRIMVDTGYIINENHVDVLRQMIKAFNVKRSSDISFKSVRSKFYTIEPATVQNLKGKLLILVNKANNY